MSEQADSPFLLGDDQDVVEEEEVDLLPRRPLEEDPAVLHEGRQLAALHHPPGGGDQRERLREQEPREAVTGSGGKNASSEFVRMLHL